MYPSGRIINFPSSLMVFIYQAHKQNCEKRILASLCLSVRSSIRPSVWKNSASIGWIFMKLDICGFCTNLLIKFKFHYNPRIISRALHGDQYTFMIKSRSGVLRTRTAVEQVVEKNQTHQLCSTTLCLKSCLL